MTDNGGKSLVLALIAAALLVPANPTLPASSPGDGETLPKFLLTNIVQKAGEACSAGAISASMNSHKDISELHFADLSVQDWNNALAPRNWNDAQQQVAQAVCEGYLAGYQAATMDNMPDR